MADDIFGRKKGRKSGRKEGRKEELYIKKE